MLRTRINQYISSLLFIAVFSLLSLLSYQVTHAEEASVEASTQVQESPQRKPLPLVNKIRVETKNLRENIAEKKEEIKDFRKELIGERKDVRASSTEARKDMRKEIADDRRELASTTRGERKELQADRRLLASSTREARKEIRDDRREMIKNEVAQRAQMLFDLIVRRLGIAIDRLDNISGRIDSRIAKLKADGVDTASMEALQVTAKAKVDAADVAVKAIVAPTLPSDTASTTAQMMNELLAGTRVQVKSAEEAIKEAGRALTAVVSEIKGKGGEKAEKETPATEGN